MCYFKWKLGFFLKYFARGCRSRPKAVEGKKRNTYKSAYALYEGRELILNAFRSGIFPLKIQVKGMRILTPKQMLQRLPIALAQ